MLIYRLQVRHMWLDNLMQYTFVQNLLFLFNLWSFL